MTTQGQGEGIQWLSVAEAARVCRRSKRSIRRWMAAGVVTKRDGPRGVLVAIPPDIVANAQAWRGNIPEAPQDVTGDDTGHDIGAGDTVPSSDTPGAEAVALRAEVDRLAALVTQMTQERDHLSEERDRWHEAFQRQQVITANLAGRMPQIPDKAASLEDEQGRPWWKRLFG